MSAAAYYDATKQYGSQPYQPGPPPTPQQQGHLVPYAPYGPRPTSAHSAAPAYPHHGSSASLAPPYQRPASAQGRDDYERDRGREVVRRRYHHHHEHQHQHRRHHSHQDGERGLVSTVVGGGAGAIVGSKVGNGSKLKIALGAVAGAVAANVVSSAFKDHRHGRHHHHGHHHHRPHHSSSGLMDLIPGASHLGHHDHHHFLHGHHGHLGHHSHHDHHRW